VASPVNVFGRVYPLSAGLVFDVPTGDAGPLVAAGCLYVGLSGTTAQRPSVRAEIAGTDGLQPGLEYLDTSLGRCIFYDGQSWRDPATGAAV
jgi:hypothetical protein